MFVIAVTHVKVGAPMTSEKVTIFKETTDDWHPSFFLNDWYKGTKLVRASFLGLADGSWRVCVWGADDCGMEKDSESKEVAWNAFLAIVKLEYVNKDILKTMGLYMA